MKSAAPESKRRRSPAANWAERIACSARRTLSAFVIVLLALASSGCAFLLPRTETVTKSRWTSYHEAQGAFELIVPHCTRTNDLITMGFYAGRGRNVKVLTYLDIIQRFMPNQAITQDDLDPNVRACIQARETAGAWEIEISDIQTKRYGNAFLDVTGFVKRTHEFGWRYKVLLLINNGTVVYKLASGEPRIDRHEKRVRPLGPLQELDNVLVGFVKGVD